MSLKFYVLQDWSPVEPIDVIAECSLKRKDRISIFSIMLFLGSEMKQCSPAAALSQHDKLSCH